MFLDRLLPGPAYCVTVYRAGKDTEELPESEKLFYYALWLADCHQIGA
jgi:hypothetical protein